ncbi:P-type calcium ATPase [Trichophyton equinum CBS 127.97]|uniref:Calcium-transporting ATPase 2 n=1 Tax=Trichophyton equinum (strain ATCC MYA-4606 / CBS 127.97) TaxID=559882 RepID=F2PMW7_TRIEC|nr:P-type calcium ATPase [Trichophyton equinum CBS 127.97]
MEPPNDDAPNPSSPLRRERAPTITIDTSAVSSASNAGGPEITTEEPQGQNQQGGGEDGNGKSTDTHDQQESTLNPSSEREREPRPISPHNISSPTSKTADPNSQNFLSVPGTRSRGNSLDSEDANSPRSLGSETCIPSSPSTGEHPDKGASTKDVDVRNDPNALKPDPKTEDDFEVENNKFAFSPGQLNKLLSPKSLSAFYALGGLAGLEKGLRTNRSTGLSIDETVLDGTVSFEEATSASTPEHTPRASRRTTSMKYNAEDVTKNNDRFIDRKRVFSDNRLPARKTKSIWELAWIAYNDNVLILLSVAAVISLALGIYQSITATGNEARVQWVEGVAIMVAIIVVVVVGAANDWQKERQFVKLNEKKEDRNVKVIRSGKSVEISVHDILVGDVMHLEPGDMVPVDGIFLEGHNVKCDESSATGESDVLRKTPGDVVYQAIENQEPLAKLDPFILSGAKVSEGVGTFLVTSTGVNSSYGKTMLSLQDEGQTTPLQLKLNVLAEYIAKLGLTAGLVLFVVLFIKFLVHLKTIQGATAKGQAFLQIFIMAVTVIVVAVPEGLPLAVTLALAFATTRMLRDNNLVRLLRACETMGNATTICSDKTGTLTQNKMTVVAGTFGTWPNFGENGPSSTQQDANENNQSSETNNVAPADCISSLSPSVKELLLNSISLNSTAFESDENGAATFVGSKTETALLTFAHNYLALGSLNEARSNAEIVQLVPFDSGRKCMAAVIKLPSGKYRMLVKGASEILIKKCTKIIADPTSELAETELREEERSGLGAIVEQYSSRSLRTIGIIYRDFEQWPPQGAPTQKEDRKQVVFERVFEDMVFLGVVGIQDPLRAGVADSVLQCQKAGVFVRMVTGDNIMTAKAIAQECGIFTPGGLAIEGPVFRKLSSHQMNQVIPRLQVLARSSPEDKRVLVAQLRKLGETVAVTGDGTNDAPALKGADVGFSMGIAGTEVAKEASAIILMDDNFNSIVKAIAWGRTVNDAVKKFLQFQITVNITAVESEEQWFVGIQFIIVGGQVLIIFVGGQAFSVERLGGRDWGISLILGLLSVPVGILIRMIPDSFVRMLIPSYFRRKQDKPQVYISDEEQRYEWNPALEEIRDQLTFLKKVRGGRLNILKYKLQHPETLIPRSRSNSKSSVPQTPQGEDHENGNTQPPTPSSRTRSRSNSAFGPAAAMAGVVAGSIAGWSPVGRSTGEQESIKFSGTGRHSGLDQQEGIEVHPSTREDDPILTDYSHTSKVPPSQNPDLTPESLIPAQQPDHQPTRLDVLSLWNCDTSTRNASPRDYHDQQHSHRYPHFHYLGAGYLHPD